MNSIRLILLIPILLLAPATHALPPVNQWQPVEGSPWFFATPEDPLSPRAVAGVTGPDFDVHDFDAAILDLLKDMQLTVDAPMQLERIEAWTRLNNSDLRAGLANTSLGGQPAILFATVKQPAGHDTYELYAVVIPKTTYIEVGGITWLMVDAGTLPDQSVFPEARRKQIATASFAQQLALFEHAADVRVNALGQQLSQLAAQQMMMNQMIDLNLDLMFGDLAVKP